MSGCVASVVAQWALFVGRNTRLESAFLFDQAVVPKAFPFLPMCSPAAASADDALGAAIADVGSFRSTAPPSIVLEDVTNGTQDSGDVDPTLPGVTATTLLNLLPPMQVRSGGGYVWLAGLPTVN